MTPTTRGAARERGLSAALARQLQQAVSWAGVSGLARAVVDTGPDDATTAHRLVLGLTGPLAALDEIADLATRVQDDESARRQLRGRLDTLAGQVPSVDWLLPTSRDRGSGCHCGCDCEESADTTPTFDVALPETEPPDEVTSESPYDAIPDTLDATALGVLAQVLLSVYADEPVPDRLRALDTFTGLVWAALPAADLVRTWLIQGTDGVTAKISQLARLGLLEWVRPPQPMQLMSGGGPIGMPGLPGGGLPGVPGGGLPGVPGGGVPGGGIPGHPDLPGGKRPPSIEDLLGKIKRPPKFWDPDDWCPVIILFPPPNYIDPDIIAKIRCLIAVLRILKERAALLPPARPARVVWADSITALETSGACAGDTLTIRGPGLPPRNKAVLLLPFADGCRPVNVPPADWNSNRIKVQLPAGVVSGPVGFGDRAYVEAYDAWAAEQNRLGDLANGYHCYAPVAWQPPFRECPPGTGVSRLRAGAPVITSFTANGVVDAVITTGQGFTLAWSVANTETVRVERTSGSGPLFGGATSVTNPAGTSWSFGAQFAGSPVSYTYRLTATGPCGSVTRDVSVAVSRRPGLRIESVEVTQSIQTIPHSVRLVRSKPTVVRVTVRHGLAGFAGDVVPGVRGRIQVRPSGGSWSPWFDAANGTNPMASNPGAQISVVAAPQRNRTNDTLNFLIPPGWNTGTVSYRIEVRVAGFGATGAFAGFAEQTSTTWGSYTFEQRRTLDLRYVRVNWSGNTPTDAACTATLRSAIPLLPTPTASITALAGVGVQSGSDTDDRDDLLDDFDDRHNCSTWEALTEWLGSDCPDDDGALWVLIPGVFFRGRAYDIPSNVCFTPPNDGPYAAHELSHCLNQEHVGVMCSNGQTATGGDPPGDWPNNAQLLDVPFDSTRNVALTLAGTGVFDVMTYCGTPNNTWPMPVRYQRLWDEIGA